MAPIHEEVHPVMVCDDVEGEDEFAARFAADACERVHPDGVRRRLEIDGPVHPDPDGLLGELRYRLAHGRRLPSLILVDDAFRDEHDEREYLAFATLAQLKFLFRDAKLPPVVLWSNAESLETLDYFAFVRYGGTQIVEKGARWPRRCDILWNAIHERPWQHAPAKPAVDLDDVPWQREILPALEHGYGYEQSVEWLASQPERPKPRRGGDSLKTVRHAVHTATSALGKNPQLLEHVWAIDPRWPGIKDGGSRRTLALAAVRAGELFIPLRHRAPGG